MDNKTKVVSVGSVVRSVAGRDRKRVFLVVGTEGEGSGMRLLTTDGRLRRTASPKRKNPSHVRVIGQLDGKEIGAMERGELDDEAVRLMIGRFDKPAPGNGGSR